MASSYEVGDAIPLTWAITVAGVPTNATVALTITLPDGTTSTPAVSNPSTGNYSASLTATQNGLHQFRWVATGAVITAESGQFTIGGLASLAELKTHLNIDATVTTFDTELQGFLDDATPVIEDITGPILPVTITEDHYPSGPSIMIDEPPLLSVISLTEYRSNISYAYTEIQDPTASALYTFRIQPGGSGKITRFVTGGVPAPFTGTVKVVYTAGMSTVPPNLRMAALEFCRDLWQQTQQAPGGYGANPGDDLGIMTSTPRWRVLALAHSRSHQAIY